MCPGNVPKHSRRLLTPPVMAELRDAGRTRGAVGGIDPNIEPAWALQTPVQPAFESETIFSCNELPLFLSVEA